MPEVIHNTEGYCAIYFVLLPICTEWLDRIIYLHNSPASSVCSGQGLSILMKLVNLGMNPVTSCHCTLAIANEETSKYCGTVYGCYAKPQS